MGVSQRFINAVSHRPGTESGRFVYEAGLIVGGVEVERIPVTGGKVTRDRSSAVRAQCVVTFEGEEWVPTSPDHPLFPAGNELALRRGVEWESGDREMVDLGVFRFSKPKTSLSEDGNIAVTVDGYDRSRTLSRARFLKKGHFSEKLTHEQIAEVIADRVPTAPPANLMITTTRSPRFFVDEGDDPLDITHDIATAASAEFYYDQQGVPVLRPLPDLRAEEDETFGETEESILITIDMELDDEDAYNVVVVVGEREDSPKLVAIRTDSDENSPTRIGGFYGSYPYIFESQFFTTQAQVNRYADLLLQEKKGILQNISLSSLVRPDLTEGETIFLKQESLGMVFASVVEKVEIPLLFDEDMTIDLQQRRILR